MEEMSRQGRMSVAAMKADMDRKTARKYVASGKLPSEMRSPREWRTREDPFDGDWPAVEALLVEMPELEAKTVFEQLCEQQPGRYEPGQLRTLQRRVARWRASAGPEREVTFGQEHRPGEAAQTDFTHATPLGVTIAGVVFGHLLCVVVLPFSNWFWATVCGSESMAALRKGVQRALFQLGRVPRYHQTDNSTAATHRIPDGKEERIEGRRRPFNEEYLSLMRHFTMTPRTTEVGQSEQNGDVEARNGALKRRLEQQLLIRGSRDFEDVAALLDEIIARTLQMLRTFGRLDDAPDEPPEPHLLLASNPTRSAPYDEAPLPRLCARKDGYSLHAGTAVHRNDRKGLEDLCRYGLRPPLAQGRLSRAADGTVLYQMKRRFSDARHVLRFEPQAFLARLCALVPPRRFHRVRYAGVIAPHSRGRFALTRDSGARFGGALGASSELPGSGLHDAKDPAAPVAPTTPPSAPSSPVHVRHPDDPDDPARD